MQEGFVAAPVQRLSQVIVGILHRFRHGLIRPGVSDQQLLFHPLREPEGNIQADGSPHGNARKGGFIEMQMVQQGNDILPQAVKTEAFPVRAAVSVALLVQADQFHAGNQRIHPMNLLDAAPQAVKKHQGGTLPGHFIFQMNAAVGKRIHHAIALFKNAALFSIWDWASPWSTRGPS